MSIIDKIQSLLTAANSKTGGTAENLTEAVQELCDGYGQGSSGTPTINGRVFDCGTFSLETDNTSGVTVQHSLGVVPSVAVMYVVDPPRKDADGNELRLMVNKLRSYSDTPTHSVSGFWNQSILVAGVGTGTRNKTEWTDTTITFRCDSYYPLRAGITYEWIALGGIV